MESWYHLLSPPKFYHKAEQEAIAEPGPQSEAGIRDSALEEVMRDETNDGRMVLEMPA